MRTARLLSLLSCALLSATPAVAQTPVPAGALAPSTTWTAAGSPYLVAGDVTVPIDGTLTIEAGTEVRFATTDAALGGIDMSKAELVVDGTLVVTGTAAAPVRFRADGAVAIGSWYGILIRADSPGASITHADIRHAIYGVYSQTSLGTTTLTDVHLEDLGFVGVVATDGVLDATRVSATNTNRGITVSEFAYATIAEARIWNQSLDCIFIRQSVATAADSEIRGSTLHGCENGVYRFVSGSSARAVRVIDSIVTGNRDYGLTGGATSTYTLAWNNVRGSTGGGIGNRTGNPLFVSDPMNLRITSRSPARNAGSVGQDLGALPYTGDPTPGLYGHIHEDLVLPAGEHLVEGDITIRPGATLTLLPGAHLSFAAGDVMRAGLLPDRCDVVVEGAFDAQGTRAAPVRLDAASGTVDGWSGVFAQEGSAVTLREVEIRHPRRGLVLAGAGSHDLDGLLIRTALWSGVQLLAGEHTLRRLHAINTTIGVEVAPAAVLHLVNALIENQEDFGVRLEQDRDTEASSEIVHSTFVGNDWSVYFIGPGTRRLRVRSSLFTGNTNALGLSSETVSRLDVTYTNAWSNGVDFPGTLGTAEGNVSVDPLYADPGSDFHLLPGSPMVDAADPSGTVLVDLEGTVRPLDGDDDTVPLPDIGAYELVLVAECGNGFVDTGEECDDGNASDLDECIAGCVAASCGDGFVWALVEECDDGNTTSGDGCDASCAREGGDVDGGVDIDGGVDPDGGIDLDGGDDLDGGVDTDAGRGADAGGAEDAGAVPRADGAVIIPGDGGADAGPGGDDSGCSCRAARGSSGSAPWIAIGFAALAGWRRRRR